VASIDGDRSSPAWVSSSISTVLANRVCTTDRSSAKGSEMTVSASSAIGLSGTAVSATVGAPRCDRSSSSTSLVVPEREITSSAS
jgi:hypothetical protein